MSSAVKSGDVVAGRYHVEEILGKGGMGIVVAANDQQLDRSVALKVLSVEHVTNREATARFLQEARAAVKLTSDHVVKVFDIGTLPGEVPYMVMEMLRGADLSGVLESEGAVPVADAVGFVVQACEAVGEAHLQGIVHRDLKPANLFLSRNVDGTSRIKVLDFGISKLTVPSESSTVSLTHTSWLLGSPVYMSPEQLRSARDVDGRADIWALGTILFELVVGRPPFLANSVPELSAKILIDPVPTPSERRTHPLPSGLDDVILRALSKDVETRYQSIAEFAAALAPFAPKRCETNLDRIERLSNAQRGTGAPESSPIAHGIAGETEETEALTENLEGTRTGWGKTASQTMRHLKHRQVVATIGGAVALGALLGVVVAPPPPSDSQVEVLTSPVHAATLEQDFPLLSQPQPVIVTPPEPQSAAPVIDSAEASLPDGGAPHATRPYRSRRSEKRPDATGSSLFGQETPLRKEFGGRK